MSCNSQCPTPQGFCNPPAGVPPINISQPFPGCPPGQYQCRTSLPMTSASLAAGASATLTTATNSRCWVRGFMYVGTALAFTIANVQVQGVNMLPGGAIAADRFAQLVEDRMVDWGVFDQTNQLSMVVTNVSAAAAVFTGILDAMVLRTLQG